MEKIIDRSGTAVQAQIERYIAGSGVAFNSNNRHNIPIKVHKDLLYQRILTGGSVGFGEAYQDGWWDCDQLDEMFNRIFRAGLDRKVKGNALTKLHAVWVRLRMNHGKERSRKAISYHYNISNEMYEKMLGQTMAYSCAYYGRGAASLDQAQRDKLQLICEKVNLQPGDRVLEIGAGFGSFMNYVGEHYKDVSVLGLNISTEQIAYFNQHNANPNLVMRNCDYRNLEPMHKFNKIISIGMFEHVGYENYPAFMKVVDRLLDPFGLFLLHTIGNRFSGRYIDPWINKYIFPDSMLPSVAQITKAAEQHFIPLDVQNFGPDYDKTLMAWHENLSDYWDAMESARGSRFCRTQKYYLLSCAGAFRSGDIQLYQTVFSKAAKPGYIAAR